MVLIFSCIWSGTLQTIMKLLWTCIIPKGILLLLFLCIFWRDGNIKLVFCILGSAAGAWNTRLHLSQLCCLFFCGWAEQGLPHILLCGLSTFYRLPSTCFLLHKPELVFKFANKILDYHWRGGSLKLCHSLCRMIQSMLFLHYLSPVVFSLACSFWYHCGHRVDCFGGGRIFQS